MKLSSIVSVSGGGKESGEVQGADDKESRDIQVENESSDNKEIRGKIEDRGSDEVQGKIESDGDKESHDFPVEKADDEVQNKIAYHIGFRDKVWT